VEKLRKRFSLLSAILDAMIESPETVAYPFEPLELPQGFRGAIRIDPEKCTGCGLCVRDCPANGLKLIKTSRDEFKLIHYPDRCAYCGQCETSCRRGAISHSNQLVGSNTNSQERMVVLKEQKPDPAEA
jgi:formate hydrogenlyase subunit 6/NADH:ubiquinone oxidoreductase subunit I